MVVRKTHKNAEAPVKHTLLFPDGSRSSISVAEVRNYFDHRRPFIGKDGKPGVRPDITIEDVQKQGTAALLFSDGGLTQVYIDEIPDFFSNRWVISTRGMISARNALKDVVNGSSGDITVPPVAPKIQQTLEIPQVNMKDKQIESNPLSGNINLNDTTINFNGLSNRKLLYAYEQIDMDNNKNKEIAFKEVNGCQQVFVVNRNIDSSGLGNNVESGNLINKHQTQELQKSIIEEKRNGLDRVTNDETIGLIVTEQVKNADASIGNNQQNNDETIRKKDYVKPKGWASLFGSNRNADMGFKEPEIFDGVTKDGVFIRDELLEPDKLQDLRLVGYFTPRFPGPEALTKVVNSWDCPNCKFYQHRSGWSVFTFNSVQDLNRVLEGGPYFVFGMTLYVKKMPPLFEFDWTDQTLLPVWVQLPSLPIALWNWPCLGRICTYIGTPQQADEATKTKERLSFARVLIEVDVAKRLPIKVPVHLSHKTIMQTVLYEDVPKFCIKCKKMGHEVGICTSEKPPEPTLYVSRAVRKYKEKAPLRKKHHNVADSEGWIVQGGKKNKSQEKNGSYSRHDQNISDALLNKINVEKDRLAKEKADRRINQDNLFYNKENGTSAGIWVPKDNMNVVTLKESNAFANHRRAGDRFDLRSDLEKELEMKRQEAFEINCRKYGFDPLNPGKRTVEWGLCDQDIDEYESPIDTGEKHGKCDFDDLGETGNDIDSGNEVEEVFVTGNGNEMKEQAGDDSNIDLEDPSVTLSTVVDKAKNKKLKSKEATMLSVSDEDKRAKYLVNDKDSDLDIEKRAAKKLAKKEKRAQNKINGASASGSNP